MAVDIFDHLHQIAAWLAPRHAEERARWVESAIAKLTRPPVPGEAERFAAIFDRQVAGQLELASDLEQFHTEALQAGDAESAAFIAEQAQLPLRFLSEILFDQYEPASDPMLDLAIAAAELRERADQPELADVLTRIEELFDWYEPLETFRKPTRTEKDIHYRARSEARTILRELAPLLKPSARPA